MNRFRKLLKSDCPSELSLLERGLTNDQFQLQHLGVQLNSKTRVGVVMNNLCWFHGECKNILNIFLSND